MNWQDVPYESTGAAAGDGFGLGFWILVIIGIGVAASWIGKEYESQLASIGQVLGGLLILVGGIMFLFEVFSSLSGGG